VQNEKPQCNLPKRMEVLPLDTRGYPIPFFVGRNETGEIDFRVMDLEKRTRAIKQKLCFVCGDHLGINVTFIGGPMIGVNRTSAEPPNHYECARWSAMNCPFLANPKMVRREDELINNASMVDQAPGMATTRNPGVTMLWITRHFECFDDGRGSYLIQMGNPERVEWYAEGKPANHHQVMTSVRSGLPSLYAVAERQEGSMKLLSEMLEQFLAYVPAV